MSFKVSDICDINASSLSKKDDFEYINYLDTANLNEGRVSELQKMIVGVDKIPSRAKRIVKENDILISTVRPNQKHYGILKKINTNMVVSTGFVVLSANSEIIDAEYLYRFLIQENITQYLQSIGESSTSTYPAIRPSVIGDLDIELPSLQEQKSIAHILSTLDDKIEVNNKINDNLDQVAQAIFKQWFVDFEFPNEDGKPYKSSGGEMVESELGMIPKGWNVGNLNKIGSFKNGKGIKEDLRTEKGNNLIFGSNGIIGKTNEILQQNPCIVIGRVGAYCGSIQLALKSCWVTDNAIIASPVKTIYFSYLYRYLLKSSLRDLAGGSAQPLINQSILNNLKTILPSLDLIEKYHNIAFSFMQNIESNINQNTKLTEGGDTLLPKLMSGEIDVLNLKLDI